MPYDSPLRLPDRPTQALAIYCSDGRFGWHTLDFLQRRLGLRLVDAVAVPGGPARLLEDAGQGTVAADVAFLIEAHDLKHAVLIQHEQCGHYALHLGLTGEAAHARQRDDLAAAGALLRDAGLERVDLYFLRLHGQDVRFEPLDPQAVCAPD